MKISSKNSFRRLIVNHLLCNIETVLIIQFSVVNGKTIQFLFALFDDFFLEANRL